MESFDAVCQSCPVGESFEGGLVLRLVSGVGCVAHHEGALLWRCVQEDEVRSNPTPRSRTEKKSEKLEECASKLANFDVTGWTADPRDP